MRLRMPPRLHPQPNPPAAHDLRELDGAIATLLLRLDPVSVAVTGDQPGPTTSSASGGPVADGPTGYDPGVQQPNPPAEPALPPRVLIADDAPAMRAALRGLLEDHGLPVIAEAADGLQAVTMAARLQPDVVVMDVRMPHLDGLQATTRITGAHPNIPGGCLLGVRQRPDPAGRPPGWRRRLRRQARPTRAGSRRRARRLAGDQHSDPASGTTQRPSSVTRRPLGPPTRIASSVAVALVSAGGWGC
jgi:CheY-like chemotaxis protein